MNTQTFLARLHRAFVPAFAVTALLTFSFTTSARADAGGIPAQPDHNPAYSAIVVLGDSLSDTGRTSAVLTQVLGTAFPPPPYAPGRISNGPVWIEYFAPMLRRSYEPLDNFAWAGATTGTLNVNATFLPGMLNELDEVAGIPPSPPRALDPKALYVVFGGANDFLAIFLGADPNNVIPAGVENLLFIVSTLHARGAQHIVVVDLPDIGRTPRARAGGANSAAAATFLSATFNSLLRTGLDALPFPVVRVSVFDLINKFVAQPHKYGFTNVTGQGILDLANSETYLFWDAVHPTTRSHRYVAEEVFHSLAAAGKLGQQKN